MNNNELIKKKLLDSGLVKTEEEGPTMPPHWVRKIDRTGDFSVEVTFHSTWQASVFERALAEAMPDERQVEERGIENAEVVPEAVPEDVGNDWVKHPQKPGLYIWRKLDAAAISLVFVRGGRGAVCYNADFFDGCEVGEWGGLWHALPDVPKGEG
jgi:hypothetical protein